MRPMKSKQLKPRLKTGKSKRNRKYLLYLSNILILGGMTYLAVLFFPIIKPEIEYLLRRWRHIEYQVASSSAAPINDKNAPTSEPLTIVPKSTDFGIVIEKINLNSPVQPNVDVATKEGYWRILENSIAHAKGTKYPGQNGNTYIFAHSTVNPLDINKYNAVFTLLHKLEQGDRIITFYHGTRYDYFVESKEIVDPLNTKPLTNDYDEPVLTLQTCYPPGTDLKRLIITAKMKYQ